MSDGINTEENIGSDGVLQTDALKEYAYTQQYIWEYLGQNPGTFVSSSNQNEYNEYKNQINNKMQKMSKRVSFDATTITFKAGETKTVNDSNGVLADYNSVDVTRDGIRFVHNKGENNMTITVDENCTLESYRFTDALAKEIGLIKGDTENQDTTIYIGFADGIQDQLYSLHYNDPVTLAFDLGIEAKGRLEITKLDSTGALVDGAVFTLSNSEGFNRDVTVSGGQITVEDLKPGIYVLR